MVWLCDDPQTAPAFVGSLPSAIGEPRRTIDEDPDEGIVFGNSWRVAETDITAQVVQPDRRVEGAGPDSSVFEMTFEPVSADDAEQVAELDWTRWYVEPRTGRIPREPDECRDAELPSTAQGKQIDGWICPAAATEAFLGEVRADLGEPDETYRAGSQQSLIYLSLNEQLVRFQVNDLADAGEQEVVLERTL